MPIEHPPQSPLPVTFRPPNSVEHPVKDGDTWITVARAFNLDVNKLVYFNFHTNNPDEVNWYLHRNTGCTQTTPNRLNYIFSTRVPPQKIFLPIDKFDMKPMAVTGKSTVSPLTLEFQGPSSPLDKIGKIFDGFTLLELGMTIAGIELGAPVMLGMGIVATALTPWVVMGGPHEAALNELRKEQIMEGLPLGIVLAADGRSVNYIKEHGYVKKSPVHNKNYPEYGKQFQGIYNQSLVAGIAHGKQFNTVARVNLFEMLWSQMSDGDRKVFDNFDIKKAKDWSDRKWDDYYRLCAVKFRRQIKLN